MWEGVPREIAKLCTQTNEDDMVRRGDPWGSDTGTMRAVGPLSTLQSVLEWVGRDFAVSSDHEEFVEGFQADVEHYFRCHCSKILRAARVQLRAYGANESAEVDRRRHL